MSYSKYFEDIQRERDSLAHYFDGDTGGLKEGIMDQQLALKVREMFDKVGIWLNQLEKILENIPGNIDVESKNNADKLAESGFENFKLRKELALRDDQIGILSGSLDKSKIQELMELKRRNSDLEARIKTLNVRNSDLEARINYLRRKIQEVSLPEHKGSARDQNINSNNKHRRSSEDDFRMIQKQSSDREQPGKSSAHFMSEIEALKGELKRIRAMNPHIEIIRRIVASTGSLDRILLQGNVNQLSRVKDEVRRIIGQMKDDCSKLEGGRNV